MRSKPCWQQRIRAHETHEVVELLDDNDEDILNNLIQDNVAIKIERQNSEDIRKIVEKGDENEEGEPISDGTRKSGRVKVPNRRYEDYELYVTVAEEEEFLLATNEEEFDEQGGNHTKISDKTLSEVAHYIMVHYARRN